MKVVNTHPRRTFGATLICMNASSFDTPLEPPSYLIATRLCGISHSVSSAAQVLFTLKRNKQKGTSGFWTPVWSTMNITDVCHYGKRILRGLVDFVMLIGESASFGQTSWSLAHDKIAGNTEMMRVRQMVEKRWSPQVFKELNMQLSSSFHYFLSLLLKKNPCDFTVLITKKKKNSCM